MEDFALKLILLIIKYLYVIWVIGILRLQRIFFFKFSNDFIQWKLIFIEYILIDTIFLYFYLSWSTEGLNKGLNKFSNKS